MATRTLGIRFNTTGAAVMKKQVGDINTQIKNMYAGLDKATGRVTKQLNKLGGALDSNARKAKNYSGKFNKHMGKVSKASKKHADYTIDQLERIQQEMLDLVRKSSGFANVFGTGIRRGASGLGVSGGGRGSARVGSAATNTRGVASHFGINMFGGPGTMMGLAGAYYARRIGKGILNDRAIYERFQRQHQLLDGSTPAQSAAEMERIERFGRRTPFEIQEIQESMMKFKVKGHKLTDDQYSDIVDAASVGTPVALERLSTVLSRMLSGSVQLREFDMIETAGLDYLDFFKKNYNLERHQITEFLAESAEKTRKVGFEFIEYLGKKFENAAAKQMDTTFGAMANFRDQFFTLARVVGAPLQEPIVELGEVIEKIVTENRDDLLELGENIAFIAKQFVKFLKYIKDNASTATTVLKYMGAALGLWISGRLVSSLYYLFLNLGKNIAFFTFQTLGAVGAINKMRLAMAGGWITQGISSFSGVAPALIGTRSVYKDPDGKRNKVKHDDPSHPKNTHKYSYMAGQWMQKAALGLSAGTTALVGAPMMAKLGKFTGWLKKIPGLAKTAAGGLKALAVNPLTWLVTATAGMFLWDIMDNVHKKMEKFTGVEFGSKWETLGVSLKGIWYGLGYAVSDAWENVKGFFHNIKLGWRSMMDDISETARAWADWFSSTWVGKIFMSIKGFLGSGDNDAFAMGWGENLGFVSPDYVDLMTKGGQLEIKPSASYKKMMELWADAVDRNTSAVEQFTPPTPTHFDTMDDFKARRNELGPFERGRLKAAEENLDPHLRALEGAARYATLGGSGRMYGTTPGEAGWAHPGKADPNYAGTDTQILEFKVVQDAYQNMLKNVKNDLISTRDLVLMGVQDILQGIATKFSNVLAQEWFVKPLDAFVDGFVTGMLDALGVGFKEEEKKRMQELGASFGKGLMDIIFGTGKASSGGVFGLFLGAGKGGGSMTTGRTMHDGGYTGSGSRLGGIDGKGGFFANVRAGEFFLDAQKRPSVLVKGGSGANVNLTIKTINETGNQNLQVESETETGSDGERILVQRIIDITSHNVATGGKLGRTMQNQFGLQNQTDQARGNFG